MPAKKTQKRTAPRSKSKAKTPQRRPIRREVGAVACLFLSIFAFLAIFSIDALFINFIRAVMRGLIGWGYYLLPFMLLTVSFMLAFHRGRPVRLRVASCFVLCLLVGSLSELFFAPRFDATGLAFVSALYNGNGTAAGGGVLGGSIALGADKIFSTIGAAVILVAATLIFIFLAFKNQILRLVERFDDYRKRERLPYEVEPEPERIKPETFQPQRSATRRPVIDIPLDDSSDTPPKEKHGLFRKRQPEVKTPDEVLAQSVEVTPEPVEPQSIDYGRLPNDVPSPTHTPALPVDEPPLDAVPVVTAAPEVFVPPAEPVAVKSAKTQTKPARVEPMTPSAEPVVSAEGYTYPGLDLLEAPKAASNTDVTAEMKLNTQRLSETLHSFGIDARIINVTRGPSVTRYELELDPGVKLTRLTNLSDDIALSLGASGVRIAPIPDKVAIVGVEVPNKVVSIVYAREIIESREFTQSRSKISFAVGRDISGESIVGDITRLPHLLIAGTTGSGKSVCMNSLIVSMLYKSSPSEVRFIMIDPKMVELNVYNGIPHLLVPVVTDPKKAAGALQWTVIEMMRRYSQFKDCSVRDFFEYNDYAAKTGEVEKIPQIVVMVDELADLMLVVAKEVEESICRIAQMGRAAGIHLVIATQSPRADVITGIMKANIPSRIAFAVASGLESRIIMDAPGADKLVGRGDMLYFPLGSRKPTRVQGCYISSAEVERVVRFVKKTSSADYSSEVIESIERAAVESSKGDGIADDGADGFDEMLPQAVEVILETGQASVSMLQRRLKLGYARAARLVDQLERRGIVGQFEGAKPRALLVTREQWEEMKMNNPEYNG